MSELARSYLIKENVFESSDLPELPITFEDRADRHVEVTVSGSIMPLYAKTEVRFNHSTYFIAEKPNDAVASLYTLSPWVFFDLRSIIIEIRKLHREKIISFTGVNLADYDIRDLKSLDLRGANFEGTDLSNIDFTGSNLSRANFENCSMIAADFSYTTCNNTNFCGADLSHSTTVAGDFFRSTYSSTSIFPRDFSPLRRGMQLIS